jgi:large subunit ribosomal protein L24
MTKLKIKKGDDVQVIAGSGKGHTGTVLAINTAKLKIKVSGHNLQTHFDKETGVTQKEGFVDYSNVKASAAPTRKKATKKKATKKAAPKKAAAKAEPEAEAKA